MIKLLDTETNTIIELNFADHVEKEMLSSSKIKKDLAKFNLVHLDEKATPFTLKDMVE